MWNQDEIKGKGKQIAGSIKETVGHLTNNAELEKEGKTEHAAGEAQETLGKVLHKVDDVVKEIGKVLTGK